MSDIHFLNGNLDDRDTTDTGFYSWNVPENRVHGDEVIARIFDISVRELAQGAPIERVIRHLEDGDRQRVAKAIHEAIVTGRPYESEYRLIHPGGRRLRVKANGRCLRDAEGVPSIYSGTVTIQPQSEAADPLESHCRAALGIARTRHNALAARYLASALNVLGPKEQF